LTKNLVLLDQDFGVKRLGFLLVKDASVIFLCWLVLMLNRPKASGEHKRADPYVQAGGAAACSSSKQKPPHSFLRLINRDVAPQGAPYADRPVGSLCSSHGTDGHAVGNASMGLLERHRPGVILVMNSRKGR